MRVSVKGRIFFPFLLLLIIFPIASCIVFQISAAKYMHRNAKQSLQNLISIVESTTDRFFIEPDNADSISAEQLKEIEVQQVKDFLAEIRPIVNKRRFEGNAQLIILRENFSVVYPKDSDEQEGCSEILAYYLSHYQGQEESPSDLKVQQFDIGDDQYLMSVKEVDLKVSSRIKYIIAYNPIENADKLIWDAAKLVLLITTALVLLFLIVAWYVAGSIAKPIRKLCNFTSRIGSDNYTPLEEISNIREIHQLTMDMNNMAVRINRYDNAQKSFFQNASHELRTPLMSIRGYAEGIQCGVFDNNGDAASIIVDESIRLTQIVDKLLILARMDNHKQELDMQHICVADFLKGYMEKAKGIAMVHHISLVLLDTDPDLFLKADEDLLSQVFSNVLSNCIRYAKKEVFVKAEVAQQFIKIIVSDDGDGFEQKDLPNLFDRFYKGKGGNFGLGLSIAKSSVEYMNGSITAYNSNDGAAFEIMLPKIT